MTQSDILKELQSLKTQIQDLQSKVNKSQDLNMFGRSYSQLGSSTSDVIIKTKGQVKIQWGSKFINLIKDGKIDVDSKFIYVRDSVGVKDGIYVIGEGDSQKVILQVNGNQINLKDQIGTTYVSFQGAQETQSEDKYIALTNIGFLYKDLSSVNESSLKNGIIYIESQKKLYIVQDGELSEFYADFSGVCDKQFIIQKNDNSNGSLVIRGYGQQNSIAFDTAYIYTSKDGLFLTSNGSIYFIINNQSVFTISGNTAVFNTSISSDKFQSQGASSTKGFRLYTEYGQSTLEVDNLVVRNSNNTVTNQTTPVLYPTYWNYLTNVISNVSIVDDSSLQLSMLYVHEFSLGDVVYSYFDLPSNGQVTRSIASMTVTNVDSNSITVNLKDSDILSITDINTLANSLPDNIIFLIQQNGQELHILRTSSNNLDIIGIESTSDVEDISKIVTRIGNLQELNKDLDKEGTKSSGFGLYSKNALFKLAQYTTEQDIPDNDNSLKFASTEWVHKFIPKGTIMMFNGLTTDIPKSWAICDGTNGTPNLVGKFIKGGASSGQEGGNSSVNLTIDNLPPHTHEIQQSSISTSSDGSHSHTIGYSQLSSGESTSVNSLGGDTTLQTSEEGAHTHTINLSQVTLSSTGKGAEVNIEPTYYTLIFIMKII